MGQVLGYIFLLIAAFYLLTYTVDPFLIALIVIVCIAVWFFLYTKARQKQKVLDTQHQDEELREQQKKQEETRRD